MPRYLLCDFDGRDVATGRYQRALPAELVSRVQWVLRHLGLRADFLRVDRTARGFHVIVKLTRNLSPLRVVLVQALLGSDYRRETFNAGRVRVYRHVSRFWRERGNVLYQRHKRSVRV